MSRMDGTGPEGNGPRSGRKLGRCAQVSEEERMQNLGKGLGRKRQSGGGAGEGKRRRSGQP